MKRSIIAIFALLAVLTTPLARAGLVGLYTFDDTANKLNDSSGAGNHLTIPVGVDPVWGATTGFNNSGAYDFSNDRLVAPININVGAMPQMTWGAWVRTDSTVSGLRKVMGHDNGAWDRTIGLDNRNPAIFRYTTFVGDDPVNNSGPLEGTPGPTSNTEWAFIAASYDQTAKTVTMYVDLTASTSADALVAVTEPGGFGPGEATFSIGTISPINNNEAWDGAIDQVFIYNEVLTPAKVAAIRKRGIPELLGIPEGDPDIALVPLNLFGDLTALGPAPGPVSRVVKISNNGATQNLNISGTTFSGPDAARYSFTPPLPAPIAPGSSADVQVVFTPTPAGGPFTATMNIASNDEDTPTATVGLNATVATDPNIRVAYPSPLFGRMTFHTLPASINRTITVFNEGVANNLTVNAPVISGTNAASYGVVSAPATIAPGGQGNIVVSLTPGATGDFAASLQFTSSDPDSPGVSVSLNGSVVLVPAATLKAFYSFDDAVNPLNDESGNGFHLTTAGVTPEWGATTGFGNSGGYQFSAGRLIGPIDVNPGVMPQMSWGAWVRTDSLVPTPLKKVMGHDNGAWDRTIGLDNRNGDFRYSSFNGNGIIVGSPGPVNTTDWTFLAATYDQIAATATVYVDLNVATTSDPPQSFTEAATFNDGWNTFAIGDLRPDITSEPWVGAIDNVFIYTGVLSDEEIRNLRDNGKSAAINTASFVVTSFQRNANGTVTLTWNSSPGATYTVHYSFDMATPVMSWPDDADDVVSQGATTTYTTVIPFTNNRRVFFSIERN
ncbi:MAG TPA: LamG-like jellyroll fold domain-containing protein [Verrucomicrobiales bacterium]|nr:LamG-like jellyroll fold domain-containing protein [Verrucomicrobiales bacterium]